MNVKTVGPIRHPGALLLGLRSPSAAATTPGPVTSSESVQSWQITISMTNTTNHDIDYSGHFRHLDEGYHYLVWDEDGNRQRRSPSGIPIAAPLASSFGNLSWEDNNLRG